MNKTLISAVTLMAGLGLATSAQAAQMSFNAELNGDKVVNGMGMSTPSGSLGTGFATLELNEAMDELAYSLTLNGLGLIDQMGTVTKIHFHTGFPNQRSPFHVLNIYGPADDAHAVFSNLTATSVTVDGIWTDADFCVSPPTATGGPQTCEGNNDTTKRLSDYVDDLIAGGIYINIHTTDPTFGFGEIRGNIEVATPEEATTVPEPGTILGLVTVVGLAGFGSRKKKA
ncbi:CHRD domain-containing protein [Crocosphaera sp. XPORK-15E]|uniref:CHRD domain-containing protein n=1 Tax=Crocosphaera sp. XPORK-15E TaxID=3110247 RepID=UPI002B220172|nr:CHRD domain-containing protein [Crocosphaera sp. XPORK-15E]MEA5533410.1 CHRD domain-containing protein [Crocosphaera sp. XPORK-15E]